MSKGVTFGDYHTYNDFGLVLASVEAPNPEPKYNYININGTNESIDLTEIFGEIPYNQRTLTFKFICFDDYSHRYAVNGQIANKLHGKKLKIILDDDKGHYYLGRVNFRSWNVDKKAHRLTFECICEPYRYDTLSTAEGWIWDTFSFLDGIIKQYSDLDINGRYELTLTGTNKIIYPVVTTNARMTLSMEGTSVIVNAGTTKLYELPIPYGETEHTLVIQGHGKFSINYRGVTF